MNQNNSTQDTLTIRNRIKRILYATDLTKSAPKVYQYVLFLAKQFNAEIVCLHVVDIFSHKPSMNFAGYYLTKEDKQKVVHQETKKSLEEMARRNRQAFICQQIGTEEGLYPEQLELTIENKVVFGNIEEQILKQSINSNCDFIVMGAHEKPRFTFTTTLSKRVMQRSQVPVAVVPIPGERKEQSTGFLRSFLPYFPAAQCK
ncbi:universal stress protein [bacterium]|nr:universal stress protein [bacterium]